MRVLRMRIGSWRNLRNVDLEVADDTSLVCLVGENGTGKSGILELLSAAAHHLGIAQGVEINRGNPLGEPHDLQLVAKVPCDQLPETLKQCQERGVTWDGQLELDSSEPGAREVTAVGLSDMTYAREIGRAAVQELRARKETQHLFLDSDRAYPPMPFNPQHLVELWSQPYGTEEFNRQWAYRPSRTLYEEWLKYLVAIEERTGAELIAAIREARASGAPDPTFSDPFNSYKELLQECMPHLRFVGVESSGSQRSVKFNSSGLDLPFSRLSGGEREIAFLTGQIDRFKLQRGLLLVDEPELHLNPDLLRTWLQFLGSTIQEGQVWFATHSLEAVEVAGPEATFVFERDPETRTVSDPRRLHGRPVLSALSAAIGSPAFSLSKLRFVFVEGDRQTRERERFYAVCGDPETNRFLEGGGCLEVLRRISDIAQLAAQTTEQLRVGGVVDRDFRSPSEADALEAESGVHVLGCHEIENVFLQPEAIDVLLNRAGKTGQSAESVTRECSDIFAGLWVVERAASVCKLPVPRSAKSVLSSVALDELLRGWQGYLDQFLGEVTEQGRDQWRTELDAARSEYESARGEADWWRHCLGKQVLSRMGLQLGFSSGQVLEQHVTALWENEVAVPEDVANLRRYISELRTSRDSSK